MSQETMLIIYVTGMLFYILFSILGTIKMSQMSFKWSFIFSLISLIVIIITSFFADNMITKILDIIIIVLQCFTTIKSYKYYKGSR